MSPLLKSLEKRIQELTASIEAQKVELAAYERVLHMEVSKGSSEEASDAPEEPVAASHPTTTKKKAAKKATKKVAVAEAAPEAPAATAPAADMSGVPFAGNKTTLVAEIVKSYGSAGATPKEVDAVFTARNVARSKNLIYNTLSYLVAQKKLQRKEGKYFIVGGSNTNVAAPAKKSAPATKKAGTKRRLSPEGLKRIKDALKKRWAAKRAAEAAATKKK